MKPWRIVGGRHRRAAALSTLMLVVGLGVPSWTARAEAPARDDERPPVVPDLPVLDQDGRALHFHRDLVKDRVVVVNFIFTTCGTICPALGAIFGKLQDELGEQLGRDVHLISVSIDPLTDTPERLKAWAAKFGARPGWTLVTGAKADLEQLARTLGGSSGDKLEHPAMVLLGDEAHGRWRRAYGFPKPAELARLARELVAARSTAAEAATAPPGAPAEGERVASAARRWFTDTRLLDQDGREVRFYSDVLAGRVVVISSFYTTCTTVCPVIQGTFARIQAALGERLGKDAFLVSLSVDPEHDTPERLREFARRMQAREGWIFLTGAREQMEHVLYKLGYKTTDRESHSTIVLIGNEPRQVWKKAMGLADASALLPLLDEVLKAE